MCRSLFLATVFVLLAPELAIAQERHGFWFNGGLGYGSLGCDNCDGREGGLSGGISLGGTLSPKFLLGIGTTGWTKSEGGVTLTTGTLDARMRFYPSRTGGFFLTGGLGVGTIHASVSGFGSDTESGLGLMLGLGYDIRVGSGLSLTPFWNGFAVRNSNSDANVGQIGLSLTVHKFTEPAAPALTPTSEPSNGGYSPVESPRAPELIPTPAVAPSDTVPEPKPAIVNPQLPPGTNFIGDTRIKLFYPATCAAQKAIPSQYQVFFQTATGAQQDGFRPSGDC
jgi:Outer membrane protein beta-barrel domain